VSKTWPDSVRQTIHTILLARIRKSSYSIQMDSSLSTPQGTSKHPSKVDKENVDPQSLFVLETKQILNDGDYSETDSFTLSPLRNQNNPESEFPYDVNLFSTSHPTSMLSSPTHRCVSSRKSKFDEIMDCPSPLQLKTHSQLSATLLLSPLVSRKRKSLTGSPSVTSSPKRLKTALGPEGPLPVALSKLLGLAGSPKKE